MFLPEMRRSSAPVMPTADMASRAVSKSGENSSVIALVGIMDVCVCRSGLWSLVSGLWSLVFRS